MIPLINYLMIAAILFGLSLVGMIINRKNLIMLLMCIELMLLAVNTNFIAFAQYFQDPSGEIFVFFILTVAAVEAAIGLAILVLLYRRRGSITVQDISALKG
ncbi:MAG TPA: NADH-quinone oxidoreductase subunit NuoK [Coxiellaceae bacterium]|nr:MAG: NADH-quinone oxidoreductase subunit K [Gammaproteobacteria bacterium RIFCSPHIGHO2_12_FULL_36_30]HLB56613.1 NADH-quinone oxidoreductase subunit NuoK [Coxiellaceae bacterium]